MKRPLSGAFLLLLIAGCSSDAPSLQMKRFATDTVRRLQKTGQSMREPAWFQVADRTSPIYRRVEVADKYTCDVLQAEPVVGTITLRKRFVLLMPDESNMLNLPWEECVIECTYRDGKWSLDSVDGAILTEGEEAYFQEDLPHDAEQ